MVRALLAFALVLSLLVPQGVAAFVRCQAEEVVHVDHSCCPDDQKPAHPDDCCQIVPDSDERGTASVAVLPPFVR
jgi:hypothetical protein